MEHVAPGHVDVGIDAAGSGNSLHHLFIANRVAPK
jgi:hypothetical protein